MKRNLVTRVLALLLCFGFVISETACTVDQVLSNIDLGLQIATSLEPAIGAVNPVDGELLAVLTSIMKGGMGTIKQDVDAWDKAGNVSDLQKALAVANTTKANLASQLASAHISDPKIVTPVTNWVNLSVATLNAIIANLPSTASPSEIKSRAATAVIPSAESLQARWTAEVCSGDAKCSKLVKVHHVHAKTHGGFLHAIGTGLGEAMYGG